MISKRVLLAVALLVAIMAIGLVVLFAPQTAVAQCGSQASSCKNCHEVKAEDPVNAKGDWHISHAFGDFCEFCHAGNVQATDKAAAHEGMVQPLGDVKANCSSCHADDYQTRAEKYATALGVTVGASNTQPPAASSGSSQPSSQPPAQQPPAQPAQETAPKLAIMLPSSSKTEIVDYNQPVGTMNRGNVIVALLLIVTVLPEVQSVLTPTKLSVTEAVWFCLTLDGAEAKLAVPTNI